MAIDMKLDIGGLVKGLFSKDQQGGKGKKARSPYQRYIIIGVFFFLLVIVYVYYVYLPDQEEIRQKQAKIDSTEQMKEELLFLDDEIAKKKQEKQEAESRFEELSRFFHDDEEVEDLYASMAMWALKYGMKIAKLEKGQQTPQFIENSNLAGDDLYQDDNLDQTVEFPLEGEVEKKEVAFYEVKVSFELTGDYEMYTYFRKDLAELEKIVNIEKETITVRTSDEENDRPDGSVIVKVTLSTLRFPSNDAEKYIQDEGFINQ